MARRRKQGNAAEDFFELFHDLFLHVPAWLCFPAALVVFTGAKLLFVFLGTHNPLLQTLAVQYGTLISSLFAFIVLIAGGAAALKKQYRRELYDKQTSLASIRELSWLQFEVLIGEAYRRQGYDVIETGGGGADGGIDLKLRGHLGEQVIVQCKQWKTVKVGIKPVRELYGVLTAEKANRAIFVTSGAYTHEAQMFAENKPLQLIDGVQLSQLIGPVTHGQTAHKIQANVERLPVTDGPPECPICRSAMVVRTARKGLSAGSKFWGCSEYPGCRGTQNTNSDSGDQLPVRGR